MIYQTEKKKYCMVSLIYGIKKPKLIGTELIGGYQELGGGWG